MKKTAAVLLGVLTALLCFSGCGDKNETFLLNGVRWGYKASGNEASIYPAYESAGENVKKYETSLSGNIVIPSMIDGKKVTKIEDEAFLGCNDIESVEIPENVTKIGKRAFYMCSSLKKTVLPESLKYIGDNAFSKTAVESLRIGKNLRSFGENSCEPFFGCGDLKEIIVSSENNLYFSENGVLFSKNKKNLIYYPSAKSVSSYTVPDKTEKIYEGAFENCKYLESLKLPKSTVSVLCGFIGCDTLKTVYVAEDNLSKYEKNQNLANLNLKTY